MVASKAEAIKRKYDRFAKIYDLLMGPMEAGVFNSSRQATWAEAEGRVLEVGVGTGRNFPYYPGNATVTAIDFSRRMLEHARRRQREGKIPVELHEMDVQQLVFPDASFDTVVATCVFCTVPDPMAGLMEVRRVLRPGGKLLMLEHVRSHNPLAGKVMDLLNPFVRGIIGTNINRDTIGTLVQAGFTVLRVETLWYDILLRITAQS